MSMSEHYSQKTGLLQTSSMTISNGTCSSIAASNPDFPANTFSAGPGVQKPLLVMSITLVAYFPCVLSLVNIQASSVEFFLHFHSRPPLACGWKVVQYISSNNRQIQISTHTRLQVLVTISQDTHHTWNGCYVHKPKHCAENNHIYLKFGTTFILWQTTIRIRKRIVHTRCTEH